MVIAHIPDVHSLADWRTDSRIVKADGDTSTIPKCGIMLFEGLLEPSMMGTYIKYPYPKLHGSSTLVRAPLRPPKMYQYILDQK